MRAHADPPRLAIVGMGRMGRAIEGLARERGWPVTAMLGRDEVMAAPLSRERLGDPDVVLEFTTAEAAPPIVLACARAGLPVVSGTTGWAGELDRVRTAVREGDGALLWASNFSVGVNLFFEVAAATARLVSASTSFDAAIVETHHAAKKDAPSGTALELQRILEEGLRRDVPATSVRTGFVPGTHELIFDAPFEQIRLVHQARDRRVFADGALLAARWLVGRRGVFDMRDVLGLRVP